MLRVKLLSDGILDKYKSRVVAKGFLLVVSMDYFHTFSLEVKSITVRVALTIALSKGWCIRQLDVNNAFSNGDLTNSVYINPPLVLNIHLVWYINSRKPYMT